MRAFKAISVHKDGVPYSLGMGRAKIIPLPIGVWVSGGQHGISAGRTEGGARQVIRLARQRKVLPVPTNMCLAEIEGQGCEFANAWRLLFKEIKVIALCGHPETGEGECE